MLYKYKQLCKFIFPEKEVNLSNWLDIEEPHDIACQFMTGSEYIVPPSSVTASLNFSTTPASFLCSLTRFADTGVPLPLVRTAAVAGARRRNTGVANITAGLYFDSS